MKFNTLNGLSVALLLANGVAVVNASHLLRAPINGCLNPNVPSGNYNPNPTESLPTPPNAVSNPDPTRTDSQNPTANVPDTLTLPDGTTIKSPPPHYVELPLDHTNKKAGTFKNKFYINDKFYKPGGPVIVFDQGESPIDPAMVVEGMGGMPLKYAEEFNGLHIIWEHRYYGESAPDDPHNISDLSVDAEVRGEWFKYLNLNQSLDDLAVFAKDFKWKLPGSNQETDLSAPKIPWVMIGASYPGDRVFYMQARYPDLFAFGLASSAPTGFRVDFWEYYLTIERGLAKYNQTGCLNDLHMVSEWLTQQYNAKNKSALMSASQTFYQAADPNVKLPVNGTFDDYADTVMKGIASDGQGWYSIAFGDPIHNGVYTGIDPQQGIPIIGALDFCRYWQSGANILNITVSSNSTVAANATIHKRTSNLGNDNLATREPADPNGGYSANMDPETVTMSLAKAVGGIVQAMNNSPPLGPPKSSSWPRPADGYAAVSWKYQCCTDLMSFITGNMTRQTNVVPGFPSADMQIEQCKKKFGSFVPDRKELNQRAMQLNQQYGGWWGQAGNIVWTNGEMDPWRLLGPDTDVPELGGPKFKNQIDKIPECGEVLPKGTQISYTIPGATHGQDLSQFVDVPAEMLRNFKFPGTDFHLTLQPPPKDVLKAQQLWRDAMSTWLKPECRPKANVVYPSAEEAASIPD